ncbi:MAG: DNA translocase FtsK [Pyrinomonadaceae bacterium]|nr:DNA translocase FtsK [Pyrinomonadaceae bacterium]
MATGTVTARNSKTNKRDYTRLNEILAVIFAAAALLIFLSLITYSPTDWSLNTVSSQATQNWVGVAGAVVADLLFQFAGFSAYFLPLLLGIGAWRLFKLKTGKLSKIRFIGYFLFIAALSGLTYLFGIHSGILGSFVGQVSASIIGNIGTGILLSAIFLTSILMITNFSIASFFSDFDLAWQNFHMRFEDYFTGYKKWREAKNKAAIERMEKRNKLREVEEAAVEADSAPALVDVKRNGERREPPRELMDELPFGEDVPPAEQAEVPTISVSDAATGLDEAPVDPPAKPVDLVADSEKIPITPVKHTGDLVADIDGAVSEPEAPAKRQKPQNFGDYELPTSEFLTPQPPRFEQKDEELLAIAQDLSEKTKEFNVNGRVMHICQGPVVTTYEFKPDPGVKYSRVTGLVDDLCLALKAESIRIERIPGKAFVGIEVPNKKRETIFLREVIESKKFQASKSLLTLALGKTIDGLNYVSDLAKMPHLLIAGATGAGKSVGVNTLVVSILYKAKPDEVKFIMVDPKRLELGVYADIPHLATPIITDPKRAAISLKWAVSEMERRYKHLAGWGVRNIDGYNSEVKRRNSKKDFDEDGEPWKPLPFIVIIIDELADLMMVSGKEVETSITRLAQMARAVGIHLVLATQRPSVDVITGLIKANFPARISFRVSSKIDSRTIIDGNGAEGLLGRGDMLFLPPATSQIVRVHGAFVDEKEIRQIVEHIKSQGQPEYDETITQSEEELDDFGELPGRSDPLFADALQCVVSSKRASTSLLQRHLRIGYGRAAAILDALVAEGYIGEMDGSKRARPILQKAYEALQEAEEGREI